MSGERYACSVEGGLASAPGYLDVAAPSAPVAPPAPDRPARPGPARHRPAQPVRKGSPIARIDDLMEKVDSKFHLVHLSAKRAREINGYFAHLGEGLGSYVPPLVSTSTNKPLSIALEEIAQGKIEGVEPSDAPAEDPLGFIEGDDGGDEAS